MNDPLSTAPQSGVAHDTIAGLVGFFRALLIHGRGVSEHQSLNGTNDERPLLSNVNYILPAFTVVNNSTVGTIKIGWGSAQFPLPMGASYTFRWKNPHEGGGIKYNDQGHSGGSIDVLS